MDFKARDIHRKETKNRDRCLNRLKDRIGTHIRRMQGFNKNDFLGLQNDKLPTPDPFPPQNTFL